MDTGWKNPILKVKAPRVVLEPIEPISLEDVEALIDSCDDNDKTGLRDKAIFLCLHGTGARAHADLNILRRYLAQTDAYIHEAHLLGSPVDKSL